MGGRGESAFGQDPTLNTPLLLYTNLASSSALDREQPDLIFGYKGIQIPFFFQVEPELNEGEKNLEQACKRRKQIEMESPKGNVEV